MQVGFQLNHFYSGPQGHFGNIDNNNNGMFSAANNTYDPNRPQHSNNDDGTVWYQGNGIAYEKRWAVTFDPSLSLRGKWLGTHDAKFGIQSKFLYHTFHGETPGALTYSDAGGGPLEGGLCDPATGTGGCNQRTVQLPYDQHQWGLGAGAYAQDRWKPIKRLTILPGMRIDYGITRNTFGQTVSNLLGFGPRLGATLDLTGDQRTIFTVWYGRSNETLSLMATGQADINTPTTTYQFDKTTKTWNMINSGGGASGYRIGKDLTPPHADAVDIGLRREVFRGTTASVTYTYKRISNIWDNVEVNQIWNPAGTKVVGFVNNVQQQINLITTPDQNFRNYQGIDFEYESRPTDNFDLYLAYTLSWTYGPGVNELGFTGGNVATQNYNPRQYQFYDGFLQQDSRHNIKVRLGYTWRGLSAGVFANYRTGVPISKYFFSPQDSNYSVLRSPIGTEPGAGNNVKSIAEFRMPDTLQLDTRVQYDFHALIKQHVSLIADFFNLLNLREAGGDFRSVIEQKDIPTFGGVNGRLRSFHFQISLRYLY
jgi:hypothetical protein